MFKRYPAHPGRKKKLHAGVRFSCLIFGDKGGDYECSSCDDRKREQRNCHNRKGLRHSILKGADEWRQVSSTLRHVLKIADIKFFECPTSAIRQKTWQLIRLVNDCTGGDNGDILHLPMPGTILDQPPWFRDAVQIVRTERAEHRQREMKNRGANNV